MDNTCQIDESYLFAEHIMAIKYLTSSNVFI